MAAIQEYIANWVENFSEGRGLMLHGPVGTGKDHLAVAAMREVADRFSATTEWIDGQSFYSWMRDRISEESSEQEAIKPYTRADVLLISDPLPAADNKAITDFQQSTLWRIIDRRYRNLKPTWVTMNAATSEEVAAKVGLQITERLGDGAIVCLCNWPSARKPTTVLK